jgi:hypothetical protein
VTTLQTSARTPSRISTDATPPSPAQCKTDRAPRSGGTAVDGKDPIVDECGHGEEVEHVREVTPHVDVTVLALAFAVETVGLLVHTAVTKGRAHVASSWNRRQGSKRACVMVRLSWLPRSSVTRSGYRSFRHASSEIVSTL